MTTSWNGIPVSNPILLILQLHSTRMESDTLNKIVYSRNVVEFVAVASEFCRVVESSAQYYAPALVDLTRKLLPLLYFKASLLPEVNPVADDPLEKNVTELDYMVLLQKWTEILGEHDTFYEVFDPDIQFGSETVTASVSENILDIYQDLKDFVMAYSLGNEEVMNDSLAECRSHFVEFWGQRLVNVLRALHQLTFSGFTHEGEMRPVKPNAPEENSSGWVNHFFGPDNE